MPKNWLCKSQAGPRAASGVLKPGVPVLPRGAAAGRVTGGRATAFSGRPAEKAVSKAIGVPRNVGPGRVTVPGSGPGGFRIPDFPPGITIRVRGSIVEVKGLKRLQILPQLRDLAAEAKRLGVTVEIFTNAPAPVRGELANLIKRGLVKISPLP